MNVLYVEYCPRGERSRTKKLGEYAISVLQAKGAKVERLDLTRDVPDLFSPERLSVYYRRNYAGESLAPADKALLTRMDAMTEQLMKADVVVIAYPMFNFSQPATVKAWFDSVMQKGKTWDMGAGGYVNLMKGRKALVISSSGGAYEGDYAFMEHSVTLSKVDLGFMGYDTKVVIAAGLNMFPEKEAEIMNTAKKNIDAAMI
ncbi:MAG: NAD(P)H-dependent oxidoreductase [Candidatus Omnitrophica bacterium]|nr:NAD(P)H-dependent oxidoreductase [Candidatus Omnitrophota bacterium]